MNRFDRVLMQSHLPMSMMEWAPSVVGQPGVRDTANPCVDFDYGEWEGPCDSDGHYMCRECRHLNPNSDSEAVVTWVADRRQREGGYTPQCGPSSAPRCRSS